MFRKKGYRIILIVIFLIILTCVSLNIKTYNSRKRTTTQIQNIVKSCVIGDIEKSYIKLPVKHNADGTIFIDDEHTYSEEGYVPDWQFMEDYIKSLPYGDRL